MGMTDKQFNAYLRMLMTRLQEIKAITSIEEKDDKIAKLLEELQKDIED